MLDKINRFRVDRMISADEPPVGMNSLLYLGNSLIVARASFHQAKTGFAPWGEADRNYGVALSEWDEQHNRYVVRAFRPAE